MHTTTSPLQKSQMVIEVTLTPEEQELHLRDAAQTLATRLKIHGFREGSVPLHLVKNEVGGGAILKEATEGMIRATLPTVIKNEGLETVGPPQIVIKKMAEGNDFVYAATVSLLPTLTLPDLANFFVQKNLVIVNEKEIDRTLEELRALRAQEVASTAPAGPHDRVVIDLDLYKDAVLVEGGSTRAHSVVLDEEAYVPGLTEALNGVHAGDAKSFTLRFPETHYQKHLAGREVEFQVKVAAVYARTLPELNDAFAQGLGQETMAALRTRIMRNITEEKKQKEEERAELEMLEALTDKTDFGELPEVLLVAEKEKMLAELKAELAERGISFEDYVRDLTTTPEKIAHGLSLRAEKRVKAALILHAFAKKRGVTVDEDEYAAECARVRTMYRDNPTLEERLNDPDIQAYIRTNLTHRKTIALLKSELVHAAPA